jgi:hypothetical protein
MAVWSHFSFTGQERRKHSLDATWRHRRSRWWNTRSRMQVYRHCSFQDDQAFLLFVYYESIKWEPKIRGKYECRCDERLQTKTKKFTRLPYTGLVLELEHLKIETRLISERFPNEMGECEN